MPTLSFLSWNIEKFGLDKFGDADFIAYVAHVIKKSNADVVGLMEIVSWLGDDIGRALRAELNRATRRDRWRYAASETEANRPHEQYVFLWRERTVQLVPGRGPHLLNIVGGVDLDAFIAAQNINGDTLWARLYADGYVDRSFQITAATWTHINQNQGLVNPSTMNLTLQQQQTLTQLIRQNQPGMFPVRGSRPPFLMAVTAVADPRGTPVVVLLFHGPSPGNTWPGVATNQLAEIAEIRAAANAVIMGDFNVDAWWLARAYHIQAWDSVQRRARYVMTTQGNYVPCLPFQRLTGPPLPAAGVPNPAAIDSFTYTLELGPDRTTLVNAVPPGTVANPANIFASRASGYDKYLHEGAQAVASSVYDLVDAVVPKGPATSTTRTPFDARLAKLTATAYNNWQNRGPAHRQANHAAIGKTPAQLSEAHDSYLRAVSDHLPIKLVYQYA